MTDEPFKSTTDAGRALATVELTRPDRGNVLTAPEIAALGTAIREAGSRADVKVVAIRSGGPAFCLGRAPSPAGSTAPTALEIRAGLAEPILALYSDIRSTEVPVIAIVHGEAKGFGAALVGQCDLAIAASSAHFSFPEMDANLPPTLAMSAVLGKVPPKRLLNMVLTRCRIDAADALSMGMLSEVYPPERLQDAAEATLSRLLDRSRPALCAIKDYLLHAQRLDPAAAARLAANTIAVVLGSAR